MDVRVHQARQEERVSEVDLALRAPACVPAPRDLAYHPARAVALLSGAVEAEGKRVLVYLTGGNVSLPAFMTHMEGLDGS